MERKTRERILDVLKENENEELEALTITEKIGGVSYNTAIKHLKELAEEGVIERKGKGIKAYFDGRKHWNYFYKLKK